MNRAQCVSAVVAGLWLAACGGDDKKSDTSTADKDGMVRVIEDAGPEPDATGEGGAGGGGGGGGDVGGAGGDVGGGGGAGGEPAVREVHDCAQACAVFEDCGRIDVWNGMIDNCLEACAPVEDDARIANFYNCLAVASCENVDACTPPEPPPPTCSDICTAMDACEGDFRLPAALPNVGECTNACSDATLGPLMTRCGASVLAGVCDPGDFDRCLLSGLYGDCFEACSRLKDCGSAEAEDAVACTLACDVLASVAAQGGLQALIDGGLFPALFSLSCDAGGDARRDVKAHAAYVLWRSCLVADAGVPFAALCFLLSLPLPPS
jgi:hypothetical protein